MANTSLHMQSTRQQILEYMQRHGRATVKELGTLLGLTSTGIRQHLTVLERDVLVEIRAVDGNERLQNLLGRVAHRLAEPYEDRVSGLELPERVKETTRIMEEQGCLVDWVEEGGDYFIDEYTCPFPKVAATDRAVCALHVDFVRQLTGGDTRLTRSLLRGERSCTYRIRPVEKPAASATS